MSPRPKGSGGGRIGLSTYLKPLEISRFSGGGGRCGGVFRLRVPWGAGAGARSIAGQSGSKSTASLARPHGQSDPVYTRRFPRFSAGPMPFIRVPAPRLRPIRSNPQLPDYFLGPIGSHAVTSGPL